ncbi:MAG TPA: hypothetical protein VM687_15675 [Stenotrophomonas sp.]|nr:hypothetical protein [Stenotrophomonas sp.]
MIDSSAFTWRRFVFASVLVLAVAAGVGWWIYSISGQWLMLALFLVPSVAIIAFIGVKLPRARKYIESYPSASAIEVWARVFSPIWPAILLILASATFVFALLALKLFV